MPRGFRRTPPAFLHYPTGVTGQTGRQGFRVLFLESLTRERREGKENETGQMASAVRFARARGERTGGVRLRVAWGMPVDGRKGSGFIDNLPSATAQGGRSYCPRLQTIGLQGWPRLLLVPRTQ
jgi:hypothetical protein